MKKRHHYRAVFISDTHLGFRGAQAKALLSFLKSIECDTLYLVGDIIDMWAMKKKIWWNLECNGIIRRILKMAKNGTKIVYLPGNHDESVRGFLPLDLGHNITVVDQTIHETINGDKYAVIHGDQYDVVVGKMRWLAVLGSTIYDLLMATNGWLHAIRVRLGYHTYWSLAGYLKQKAKKAVSVMKDFEQALVHHAAKLECKGVICGHIHNAKVIIVDDLIYANCGDWIESLTALVENDQGEIELLHWHCMLTHHVAGKDDHHTATVNS